MGWTAPGRRLHEMAHNTATIVAIELLAAAQGVDCHQPLTTSPMLAEVHQRLRAQVSFYDKDRFFAPDIEAAKQLVLQGAVSDSCKALFAELYSR